MIRWTTAALAFGLSVTPALGQDTPPATAVSPLEQRRNDAQLRADIAKAEADEATARARLIPSPPTAGETKAEAGAGEPEAMILATLQVQFAATEIVQSLADDFKGSVFVAAGSTLPSTAEAEAFELRTGALALVLESASRIKITIPEEPAERQLAAPTISAAVPVATLISMAASALSWLQTDTTIAGVSITKPEDETLVSAFLWAGNARLQPLEGLPVLSDTRKAVQAKLTTLTTLRGSLEPARGLCLTMRARINATKDDARTALQALYAGALASCDQIDVAVAAYDAFTGSYKDGEGDRLQRVLEQRDRIDRLGDGQVLLVSIPRQEAAAYTQTNVFSALGAMPYHVTAATDIIWRLVDKDGTLVRAGFGSRYSGYQQISEVDRLVNRESRASERRHRRLIGRPAPNDSALPAVGCWARSSASVPEDCRD